MDRSVFSVLGLVASAEPALREPVRLLAAQAMDVVGDRLSERSIGDGPFERFWGNPDEPRHSKLIGYFIDPKERHYCGDFLLEKFLRVLIAAIRPGKFPVPAADAGRICKGCQVYAEKGPSNRGAETGQIDIRITRRYPEPRFAIIVENKIFRGPNQRDQLWRYVQMMQNEGFKDAQIFVFFLPLINDYTPNEADRLAIVNAGVTYTPITFEQHVGQWLRDVLDEKWPENLSLTIREHLSYYRHFINFLINRRKGEMMSQRMIDVLKAAPALPVLEEIQQAERAIYELKRATEQALAGRMLLKINRILGQQGIKTEWYETDGARGTVLRCEAPISSEFDERLQGAIELAIKVGQEDRVRVAIGTEPAGVPTPFWISYLRVSEQEKDDPIAPLALTSMKELFVDTDDTTRNNPPWYKWKYWQDVTYANASDDAAAYRLADTLIVMRDNLTWHLTLTTLA